MAKLLKLRRGTTSQHGSFTGAEGEVTVDTDKETLVVHDGSTAGGHPVAAEDMSNVSSASIAGRLSNDSIAVSKIAAGTLPSDVKVDTDNIITGAVTTGKIATGTIINGDISSSAGIANSKLADSGVTAGAYGSSSAIPIVTVNAKGVVTAASTTAIDSTQIANGNSNVSVANNGNITITRGGGNPRLTVDAAGVEIDGTLDITGNVAFSSELNFMGSENNKFLDINLGSNTFNIRGTSGGDGNHVTMMTMQRNGATTLTHAGSTKLSTTSSGVSVTGNISSGDITVQNDNPAIRLTDTNNDDDFSIRGSSGMLRIRSETDSADRLIVNSDGHVDIPGNLDVGAGVDVTGNITVSGTVDGVDIAAFKTEFDNAFPSGTKMLFQQTSAPTGWTKDTTHNNKALRVVSGTAGTGGSNAFSNTLASRGITANSGNTTAGGNVSVSVANGVGGGNISVGNTTAGGNLSINNANTSGNVNSHTLSVNEMPSHSHNWPGGYHNQRARTGGNVQVVYQNNSSMTYGSGQQIGTASTVPVSNTGGNGGHSHGFSGSSHSHSGSLSGTAHNHSANFSGNAHGHNATASFSGTAHNHSISVGNLDMAVQYVDIIIASKD